MTLALPRFQSSAQLVDSSGYPTIAFHIWWDTFARSIEAAFNDLSNQVAAIAAAQAAAAAAQTTANTAVTNAATAQTTATTAQTTATTAQTNAATAQGTANTAVTNAATAQGTANTAVTNAATAQGTADVVKRNDKISASSVLPANVLSASDAGSNTSIVVAAHSRLYGDGASLSVAGHTFTGLAYSTVYGVYYDDTTTSDTTPTYHTTTNPTQALNGYITGRHLVGIITTPASGGTATTGGSQPPGTGGVDKGDFSTL